MNIGEITANLGWGGTLILLVGLGFGLNALTKGAGNLGKGNRNQNSRGANRANNQNRQGGSTNNGYQNNQQHNNHNNNNNYY